MSYSSLTRCRSAALWSAVICSKSAVVRLRMSASDGPRPVAGVPAVATGGGMRPAVAGAAGRAVSALVWAGAPAAGAAGAGGGGVGEKEPEVLLANTAMGGPRLVLLGR